MSHIKLKIKNSQKESPYDDPTVQAKCKRQKGISLLLVVLILSVVLATGLGISAILFQQIKMMGKISNSVIAFYAADNGIEEILTYATPSNIPSGTQVLDPTYGATYEVIVKPSGGDCDAPSFCIKSIGTYKETKRAIEIKY